MVTSAFRLELSLAAGLALAGCDAERVVEAAQSPFSDLTECREFPEPGETIYRDGHWIPNATFGQNEVEALLLTLERPAAGEKVRVMSVSPTARAVWAETRDQRGSRGMWFRAEKAPSGWRVVCYLFFMH